MRLEQRDSYLRRFTARVRALEEGDRGTWVTLDASAFYPASGGQPHDTGRLGTAAVTDVRLVDGKVWHRIDGAPPEPGREVQGVIDWDRRYRHMQRHSAQHLLSQAFVRHDPALETRSVSLGGADCTVDLAGEPDDDALLAAETLVNAFAYDALPIVSFEIDEREAGDYPLRRAPKVHGRIRLVAMGDVEVAACGGTHVAGTAETLPIKVLGAERVRGGLRRVSFRAGWDAIDDYRAKHGLAASLVRRFSAPLPELADRVATAQGELAALRQALAEARRKHARDRAETLLAGSARQRSRRVVRARVDEPLLEPLLDALTAHEDVVALLAAEGADRARLAFARGGAIGVDLRPVLDAALAEIDGRGGGRPERVQGAGSRVEGLERALQAASEALRRR